MENNCINNSSLYPVNEITVDGGTLIANTRNIIKVGSEINVYLPDNANKGDIFIIQAYFTPPNINTRVRQKNGQSIIVGSYISNESARKRVTTVGTSGYLRLYLERKSYTFIEYTLICIEQNTTFLALCYSGYGMYDGSFIY